MISADYDYADIVACYRALGVTSGRIVYVGSDLARLMRYAAAEREAVLPAHLDALQELLGPKGTLVVPTSTLYLCNTDQVFDPDSTPSRNRGVFSEFVRTRPGALRSFHPFMSYAALGARAEEIVASVARHPFGPRTPEDRMIEAGALCLSIGLHPRFTCSTVHAAEMAAGVPYRYAKEFVHPVRREGQVGDETFYMMVWYRDTGLVRDGNETLWRRLDGMVDLKDASLGRGRVWSYDMHAFFLAAVDAMVDDPYVWCRQPPIRRPYRL